jgi:hypothetical protein
VVVKGAPTRLAVPQGGQPPLSSMLPPAAHAAVQRQQLAVATGQPRWSWLLQPMLISCNGVHCFDLPDLPFDDRRSGPLLLLLLQMHVQNATLAGGVAIGAACSMRLPPAATLAVGALAGRGNGRGGLDSDGTAPASSALVLPTASL